MENKSKEPIYVTKTYLPEKAEYETYLDKIWQNGWLTNEGPLVKSLQIKLQNFLDVPYIQYTTNGTIALQLAIKVLELKGEIITTPYSYVATASSIIWEGNKPVFCDISAKDLCIDPNIIEDKITDNTCAILATHVYGIPCSVEAIEKIARKNNLKVIYDGAHAFGVNLNNKSIFNYGDLSTASFHATKIFHTVEGGAIFSKNKALAEKIRHTKSFGHKGDDHKYLGINGKNSEFHAAMGLCNLKRIDDIVEARKNLFEIYMEGLKMLPLTFISIPENVRYNYAYFPVIFENAEARERTQEFLEKQSIFPRRYFFPSINTIAYMPRGNCPVSEEISDKILCLPFYPQLNDKETNRILTAVKKSFER
ncbi:DegT/DnrJ/EryC1/StrS family aminotransferase [Autumnicola edwardsiae]|uniref:DegT/DnrJ/EryC1/StrS family aminotransferase n=1 Tax=Autumnicola edwardsiae TaxID=3075594 RepID=A0ABU3CRW1_9FLAO|nr:DegT/DnrJ/EryC1/StrS family aminotransferase [Zunongwangia sp. F297]MDT0649097.1 DegT/DnrJ/EryC1/StrS family aminotransferase [Zunongwangia sp. F297]